MKSPYNHIHIIINPAAGKDEAILNTLNRVFKKYDQEWSISITYQSGDAAHQAKEAVDKVQTWLLVMGEMEPRWRLQMD